MANNIQIAEAIGPIDVDRTAHIAVHVQNCFFNPSCPRPSEERRQPLVDKTAHKIAGTAKALYEEGVATCWVRMENDDISDTGSELYIVEPSEHDVIVADNEQSAMKTGTLLHDLKNNGVTTLIISGGYVSECLRETVVDALNAGFKVIVMTDCVVDNQDTPYFSGMFCSKNRKNLVFAKSETVLNRLQNQGITPQYPQYEAPSMGL